MERIVYGESYWDVPWSMHVDPQGYCWLSPPHSWCKDRGPGGTVQMKIYLTSKGAVVDISRVKKSDFQWTASIYNDHQKSGFIPVVRIYDANSELEECGILEYFWETYKAWVDVFQGRKTLWSPSKLTPSRMRSESRDGRACYTR